MIRRSRPERAGPERAGPDRVLDEAGGAIDALVEPLTGRSLGELGLVDALEPGTPLVVRVALPSEHYPLAERLRQAVKSKKDEGYKRIKTGKENDFKSKKVVIDNKKKSKKEIIIVKKVKNGEKGKL
jgi:hypothetical protein